MKTTAYLRISTIDQDIEKNKSDIYALLADRKMQCALLLHFSGKTQLTFQEADEKIKQIFDPYGTMNPGVKIGVAVDDIKPLVRQEYGLGHMYDHLPRS